MCVILNISTKKKRDKNVKEKSDNDTRKNVIIKSHAT